jgi:hypothetical protein
VAVLDVVALRLLDHGHEVRRTPVRELPLLAIVDAFAEPVAGYQPVTVALK